MQLASSLLLVVLLLTTSVLYITDVGAAGGSSTQHSGHRHKHHFLRKRLEPNESAAAVSQNNSSDADIIFYSSLFGLNGSAFEQGFRMFDPAWAGYKGGYKPPESGETRLIDIVQDFGAVPDDNASDSEALAAAVASVDDTSDPQKFTVIYFPPGRYLLTTNITISKPVVLRGAGKDATLIYFNASMDDLYPDVWGGRQGTSSSASPWSFRHMLIEFKGEDRLYDAQDRLSKLAQPTVAGSRVITVASTKGIEPGMKVRIVAKDPGDGSLIRYLFGDSKGAINMDVSGLIADAKAGNLEGEDAIDPIRFVSRVSQVFPSTNQILLKRAIPYALQLRWSPAVKRYEPKLQNVGIEGLTLEHKWSRYPGHFKELGHNSVSFVKVSNCWARDLRILNADSAVALEYSHSCSISNVELGVTASRSDLPNLYGISCHHGFSVGHSADILFTNFKILTRCEHDISWDWWTSSSVAANGMGIDLNNDMHRSAPHGNLISNVSCGLCSRPFASGGAKDRGLNAGMKNTFWNLYTGFSYDSPNTTQLAHQSAISLQIGQTAAAASETDLNLTSGFDLPPSNWGVYLNFVGCSFRAAAINSTAEFSYNATDPNDLRRTWRIENVSPQAQQRLHPQDLWSSMRDMRHARARRERNAAAVAQMLLPAAT